MTVADPPPPTRRSLRESGTDETPVDVADMTPGEVTTAPTEADAPAHEILVSADVEHPLLVAAGAALDTAPAEAPENDGGSTGHGAPIVVAETRPAAPAASTGAQAEPVAAESVTATPVIARPVALAWVDPSRMRQLTTGPAADAEAPLAPPLITKSPRRSPFRPGVLVPILALVAIVGLYCATTLLWPLYAIEPEARSVQLQPATAVAATPAWPAEGTAAVAVEGIGTTLAASTEAVPTASIAKLVTSLLVLDELPLAPGESGPEYSFDSQTYWTYLSNNESALEVPVGGTLTEYQMLQGILIGSANNYADRLASELWPTDAVYADAANSWLTRHGIPGITIADPSGLSRDNTATPESLIPLARRALADPVIAEIVATQRVELPGAGLVENTNALLADPGVIGLKTGGLTDSYNLLSAKDVQVGEATVRLYAAALGQPDHDARDAATRALFDQLERELQPFPSVSAGTPAGVVETAWGERIEIETTQDAAVVLWDGATAETTTTFALDDQRAAGDTVGSVEVTGPVDAATVPLRLADDIEGPTPLWRLTHPLELFGLS